MLSLVDDDVLLTSAMFPQSWYKYLVIIDADHVYCDHLAVCLLGELVNKQENPVLTSYQSLSDLVNHLIPEVKHSLELLQNIGLLQVKYPTEPEKLLSGAIAIHLNCVREACRRHIALTKLLTLTFLPNQDKMPVMALFMLFVQARPIYIRLVERLISIADSNNFNQ